VTAPATPTDGRLARGERTRAAVLRRAADIASVDGLDGLSIGRLAGDLSVSKAGVFAHFGSKEDLQLATIAAAAERFADEVVVPALAAPEGLDRLVALYDCWLDYSRRRVFPGGCFFFCTFAEFHARPGRVRDELAAVRRRWLDAGAGLVADARDRGEIAADCDPDALAFELDAIGMAANLHDQLCDDPTGFDRARAAVRARLRSLATAPHPALD
jgi:AcrR family transcriptional regulator